MTAWTRGGVHDGTGQPCGREKESESDDDDDFAFAVVLCIAMEKSVGDTDGEATRCAK